MRLYTLVISLSFLFMVSWPSLVSAADDNVGKFSVGSKPAAETSSKVASPSKPGRPGGGSGGRPNYDFNKPGRPGDHHPGRPGGGNRPGQGNNRDDGPRGADAIDHQKNFYGALPTNSVMYGVIPNPNADGKSKSKRRPNRNNYGWGSNCYPYCNGVGLWYDDDDDDDRGAMQYTQPREPERSFQSGGAFERFEDPRDAPAHDTGYPNNSGNVAGRQSPAQSEIEQYHMMMKAWQ